MHFVPIKTPEQQEVLILHRTRKMLSRQRTMMLNAFRSHLAEFGIIAPKGPYHVMQLAEALREGEHDLPEVARTALIGFAGQRVIEQITKQKLPEGFQTAEFLLEHGMIDFIVERTQFRQQIGTMMDLYRGATAPTAANQ